MFMLLIMELLMHCCFLAFIKSMYIVGFCLQLSFLMLWPILILTYLGQAAWLTAFPDQVSSTFYASIPYGNGFYWVRLCAACTFVDSSAF